MTNSELSEKKFKRICVINWLLSIPLLVLFGGPYLFMGQYLEIHPQLAYAGALIFSVPFTLTILHGHVTIALGSLHRHHYYNWLDKKALTYGLFFHPVFASTRFRLILVVCSIVLLLGGWMAEF